MKAIYPGHLYEMDLLDGSGKAQLQYVSRAPRHPAVPGVTCQEVIRTLIDRVGFLDSEIPWAGNAEILYHLRMAMVLFEARAIVRHVEKGHLQPENALLGEDGHFVLAMKDTASTP